MTMNQKFREKENPSAKIAFFVWDSHQYYNYKNIASYLTESEYVVCDTWHANIRDRGNGCHIDEIIDLLEKNNCHWRVITEINDSSFIEYFLKKYDILVSTLMWPPLSTLSFKTLFSRKKTVRILDGCSKGLATFAPWSAYFDIALAYGSYTEEYLKLINTTYIVGNHKFDDWFSGAVNREETENIMARLDPSKKTILYLPTHSGLSSLHNYASAVALLRKKYNVLAKLHRHSWLSEANASVRLLQDGVLMYGSKDDLLSLIAVADAVITDSSSVSLEVLLSGKPMIILDVVSLDKEAWRKHQEGEEFNGYWYSGGLEYEESAGKKLRDIFFNFNLLVKSPDKIESALLGAFGEDWKASEDERNKFKNYIFAHQDGKSGERAARIIRNFLTMPKPTSPLLGAAIRAYFPVLNKNYAFGIQKALREIKRKDQEIKKLRIENLTYYIIKKEQNILKKIYLLLKYLLNGDNL